MKRPPSARLPAYLSHGEPCRQASPGQPARPTKAKHCYIRRLSKSVCMRITVHLLVKQLHRFKRSFCVFRKMFTARRNSPRQPAPLEHPPTEQPLRRPETGSATLSSLAAYSNSLPATPCLHRHNHSASLPSAPTGYKKTTHLDKINHFFIVFRFFSMYSITTF